jgi:enoyl-CoA hydratase/carnithine racemase
MNDAVRDSVTDGIAVVTIDHPPVNAINRALREGT